MYDYKINCKTATIRKIRGDEMASIAFIGGVITGIILCCIVVIGCSDEDEEQDDINEKNAGGG